MATPDAEDLAHFLAVARGGTFSAAARTLGVDQSTVSRRVQALEATLGKRLFERGPRAVTLTPLGEDLMPAALSAESAFLSFADAARARETTATGRVRITMTEGIAQHAVIPHVLPPLFAAHPALAVELVTSDEAVDLARHDADVALRFFRSTQADLVARKVARLSMAVLVARSKRRAFERRSAAELPWIGYTHPAFEDPTKPWLAALGAPPPRLTCTSVEAQIAAVRAGLGVAVATRVQTQAHPELVELATLEHPVFPSLELYVVTRAAIRRVPRIAVVVEALVSALGALEG